MKTRKTKVAKVTRKRGRIVKLAQIKVEDLSDSKAMLRVYTRRPVGWFSAHLPRFLEGSHTAVVGNAVQQKKIFLLFCCIDESFQLLNKQVQKGERLWLYHFFIRAYSTWLAAIRTYMSGQLPECYSIIRSALETMAYGYHFETAKNSEELIQLWMNRHTLPKEEKKEAMKNFGFYRCINKLHKETRDVLGYLYETSIDLGAHPNLASIAFNIEPSIGNGSHMFLGAADVDFELPGFMIARAGLSMIEIVAELEPQSVKGTRVSALLDYSLGKTAALARRMHGSSSSSNLQATDLPYDIFLAELSKSVEEIRQSKDLQSKLAKECVPESEE